MSLGKVCLITLGCKVNKYESDCMSNILKKNNYETTENFEFADYYIINTCAVTNEGEKKSRQYISKINKLNPNAKIIVCGCASDKDMEQFASKHNVISILGNEGKDRIVEYIENSKIQKINSTECYNGLKNPHISSTRAYIKIQDGCNRFCSYCIIPFVRGRSRSREIHHILLEIKELSKTSKEIVLVGIDISDFRVEGNLAMAKLLKELKDIPARIRLGSVEANVITEELMQTMVEMENFAPHFHLSLQSGDNEVLKKMNRKYTAEEFEEKCNIIRKYFPNANITTDIIVGFPTETEEQFNNTVEFAKRIGFGKIHAFPYSSRTGTVASKMKDLPQTIKKQRMNIITEVADNLAKNYHKSNLGKTAEVLLEEIEDNYYTGYTETYIKTFLPIVENFKSGDMLKVKLLELYKEGIKGEYLK